MESTITRRRLIRSGTGLAVAAPVAAPLAAFVAGCGDDEPEAPVTTSAATTQSRPRDGAEALELLLEGNERFAADRALNEGRESVHRAELAEGQEPFAAILGCADSRVPPEVLFDQGLGDLFVVRIAGNTAVDPLVVGSIEYAAEHLGSVLIMVLGHQACGAVTGAVAAATEGAEEPGSIDAFIEPIVPVVEEVSEREPDLSEEQLVEQSVQANVRAAVEELEAADGLIAHLVESGEVKLVGAEYEFDSGKVAVL